MRIEAGTGPSKVEVLAQIAEAKGESFDFTEALEKFEKEQAEQERQERKREMAAGTSPSRRRRREMMPW